MKKTTRFFLGLSAVGLGVATAVTLAHFGSITVNENAIPVHAEALNTLDFAMRNEEGKFTMGPNTGYAADGYKFEVTDSPAAGWDDQWWLGPACFSCPVDVSTKYFFEFAYSISGVKGEGEGGPAGSAVRMDVGGAKNEGYVANFSGTTLWSNHIYKTGDAESAVEVVLKLAQVGGGAEHRAFTVTVKEFVIKANDGAGAILKRVNFQSGASFATEWNTSHSTLDLCTGEENIEKAKGLIIRYCALTSGQRAIVDATDDSVYSGKKIGEAIRIVAEKVGMTIEG